MDTRPRISLISLCTVQLRTLCAAHSLATLCLCTTSGPDPGNCPASGAPWSSAMPPSLGRGRVTNNNGEKSATLKSTLCNIILTQEYAPTLATNEENVEIFQEVLKKKIPAGGCRSKPAPLHKIQSNDINSTRFLNDKFGFI